LIVRCFAVRHPEKTAALLLVDPVDTADWVPLSAAQNARLKRGVSLSRRGAWLARFGVVRFALKVLASGNNRLPRLISRWSAGGGSSVTDRLVGEVRKLPKRVWPMVQMHWSDEKCFETMAEYLEMLPENAAFAEEIGWPSEHIPAIVITIAGVTPRLPPGCRHRTAEKCGHWIQLDQPELVVTAIEELLQRVST
jgi:pimeloyl-ACP methyl ester carboxylesterase